MALIRVTILSLLIIQSVSSYRGGSLESCPKFEDRDIETNGLSNGITNEAPFSLVLSDTQYGYLPNLHYDLMVKARDQFRPISRFLITAENSDETCEDVNLVPELEGVSALEDCPGVWVSDGSLRTMKVPLRLQTPSCGCIAFKARVFESTDNIFALQSSTSLQLTVCPNTVALDGYLNTLVNELEPETSDVTEDHIDGDGNAVGVEDNYTYVDSDEEESEEEDETEEEEDVDFSDMNPEVDYPSKLCREFYANRETESDPLLRRRWNFCCSRKRTIKDLRKCLAKIISPRDLLVKRMGIVCRAFDTRPSTPGSSTTTTTAAAGRCCSIQNPNRRAFCFHAVKFQTLNKFCDGVIPAPVFVRPLGPQWVRRDDPSVAHSCCSSEGESRFFCFERHRQETLKVNMVLKLVEREGTTDRLCEAGGSDDKSLKGCCELEVYDRFECMGTVLRDRLDGLCQSGDGMGRPRASRLQTAFKRSGDCCEDTDEKRYRCFLSSTSKVYSRRIRSYLRMILHATLGGEDSSSEGMQPPADQVILEISGDSEPEQQSGRELFESTAYTAQEENAHGQRGYCRRADERASERRTRHELRILNRLCKNGNGIDSEVETKRSRMMKCCVFKGPIRRRKCLQSVKDEKYEAVCRGEATPFAQRLGGTVGADNPCCREEDMEERSCCFKKMLSTSEKLLEYRPPLLARLENLKNNTRGQQELRRMELLCTSFDGLKKKDIKGRHAVHKCCQSEGDERYLCLLQVFRAYTDKVCSGRDVHVAYQIGHLGEVSTDLEGDFLEPDHACCQLEGREKYRCVLAMDPEDREVDEAEDDGEKPGKKKHHQKHLPMPGKTKKYITIARKKTCDRIDEFQEGSMIELLGILRAAKSSVTKVNSSKESEEEEEHGEKHGMRKHGKKKTGRVDSQESTENTTETTATEDGPDKSQGKQGKGGRGKTQERDGDKKGMKRPNVQGPRKGQPGKRSQNSENEESEREETRREDAEREDAEGGEQQSRPARPGGKKHPQGRGGKERKGDGGLARPPRRQGGGNNEDRPEKGSHASPHHPKKRQEGSGHQGRLGGMKKGKHPGRQDPDGRPQGETGGKKHGHWKKGPKNDTSEASSWNLKPFNDSSAVIENLATCCEYEGWKFAKCLWVVQTALLERLCDMGTDEYDQGNFTLVAEKLDACCPLEGKNRTVCFYKDEDDEVLEEESQEEDQIAEGTETQEGTDLEQLDGEEDGEGELEDGANRQRRNAGWWASKVSTGSSDSDSDQVDSSEDTATARNGRGRGRGRFRGIWRDGHVNGMCLKILDRAAVGAFGAYRDDTEQEEHDGELRMPELDRDHESLTEMLRDCCVMVDEVERSRCVRRIRGSLADRRCDATRSFGRNRGIARRRLPFPPTCCDVTDEERYRCVNNEPPIPSRDFQEKTSRPSSDNNGESSEETSASTPPSVVGPLHNFVRLEEFQNPKLRAWLHNEGATGRRDHEYN